MNLKKKIIIAVIAAVLIAGAVTAAVLFGNRKSGGEEASPVSGETSQTAESVASETEEPEALYIADGLTVSDIFAYSGEYVEDGSGDNVSGIAAVRLSNKGEKSYEYLEFTLKTADEEYFFKASGLLPGTEVTVLSADKKALGKETGVVTGECSLKGEYASQPTMREDLFKVYQTGPSATIRNISGKELKGKTYIYYKGAGDDGLLGGITYRFSFNAFGKDEIKQKSSSHLGKVLFVTYEE